MTTSAAATPPGPETRALVRRRVIQLAAYVAVQAAVLFLGSGRPGWTNAWVYLGSYVSLVALTALVVRDPELFAERACCPACGDAGKAGPVGLIIGGLGVNILHA